MFSENQKFKLSTHQVASYLGDECVVLNHNIGEYYTLNELGTQIWKLLETGEQNLQNIIENILEEYEIDLDTLKIDLDYLLKSLINEQLVEII